jgi:hypothetical protein
VLMSIPTDRGGGCERCCAAVGDVAGLGRCRDDVVDQARLDVIDAAGGAHPIGQIGVGPQSGDIDLDRLAGIADLLRVQRFLVDAEKLGQLINSIAYLASTRLIAGVAAIVPLFAGLVIIAFLSPQLTTTWLYGQSHGTYEHYFRTFLRPEDVFWSFVQCVIIAVMVMVTHCYYGYNASGGPVGVGEAVGRSMRFSLVSVQVVVLAATLAVYGVNPNFALTV